jgi:hypothetical protein
MAKREVYLTGVKARLALWNSQLESHRAKAGDQVTNETRQQLDAWKAGASAISDKVAELERLDRKWYVVKVEMEKALRGIEAALGQADGSRPAVAVGSEPVATKPKSQQSV